MQEELRLTWPKGDVPTRRKRAGVERGSTATPARGGCSRKNRRYVTGAEEEHATGVCQFLEGKQATTQTPWKIGTASYVTHATWRSDGRKG